MEELADAVVRKQWGQGLAAVVGRIQWGQGWGWKDQVPKRQPCADCGCVGQKDGGDVEADAGMSLLGLPRAGGTRPLGLRACRCCCRPGGVGRSRAGGTGLHPRSAGWLEAEGQGSTCGRLVKGTEQKGMRVGGGARAKGKMGPTTGGDHTCLGWAELSIWSAVAEWRALLTSWRHRRRAAPRVSSDMWRSMLCRKARASLPQAPRVSRTNAVRAGPGYRVCLARSLRPMACCDPEEASSCAESTQETSRWMLRF